MEGVTVSKMVLEGSLGRVGCSAGIGASCGIVPPGLWVRGMIVGIASVGMIQRGIGDQDVRTDGN